MRKHQWLAAGLLTATIFGCNPSMQKSSNGDDQYERLSKTSGSYTYDYVTNDPLGARIYTLKNGLKVYLSVYKDAPRIQTFIAVKAGGKNDPSHATGLAHYLEHMMFKGSTHFGTQDYAKEKVYLDSIENMYEHYRTLKDPAERKAYYAKIDKVSNEASKYAIANEYDKMVSMLGAKGTNAYTTEDRTVYVNDIPSSELERWLKIEADRFEQIVNRLFHTELEAVYEEKNRSLDNDRWQVSETMMKSVFPTHKYGTQTVIGTIEHLKNPSITEIKNYFNKYYIPNNAAICLSGDLDPDKTIALIDQYFGGWERQDLEAYTFEKEAPITAPVVKEVFGSSAASVSVGFRFPGESSNSKDFLMMKLCDMVLSNSSAGLIDLNLSQQQKVVAAGCYPRIMNDYTIHTLYGVPKEGQTLEEVQQLLLEQIEKLKKGEFEDWLLDAVINDFKKSRIKKNESNKARAEEFVTAFTNNLAWEDYIDNISEMGAITKEELVKFAQANYKNNYAVIYKRTGENPNKQKVEKPSITKVAVNRDKESAFLKEIVEMPSAKLKPLFLDYQKDIQESRMNGNVLVRYKQNVENELFNTYYLLDVGSNSNPKLSMAVSYLSYLGSDKLSAEEIKKELYKLGCDYNVSVSGEQIFISISGLSENMEKAMAIVENLLANPKADEAALQRLVANIIKSREDSKKNKSQILFKGLMSYGLYGADSPVTNNLSNKQLQELKSEELIALIKGLTQMEHRVLYYGPKPIKKAVASLNSAHKVPETLKAIPEQKTFYKQDVKEQKVYWTHYDMVQTEILFLAKGNEYNPKREAVAAVFNEYFGGGMGSIVFQEMREAQGLAYTVFSSYAISGEAKKSDHTLAYVGCQADKLKEAMAGMKHLLDELPENEQAFETAKKAILSKIESERITKSGVLFNYEAAIKKGLDKDLRKDTYEIVKSIRFDDIKQFHSEYIKGQKYNICVIGNREMIDFEALKAYGKVRELSLEDLFAYDKEVN